MADLSFIDYSGYLGVRIDTDKSYEKLEVYCVDTKPARLLRQSITDKNVYLDTAVRYEDFIAGGKDREYSYRAFGFNECSMFRIGATQKVNDNGYDETTNPEEFYWAPSWYNLIKNAPNMAGSSYQYHQKATSAEPTVYDLYDRYNGINPVNRMAKNSLTWKMWKCVTVDAAPDKPIMSYVITPKQAFKDIFKQFRDDYQPKYKEIIFSVFVNTIIDDDPPTGLRMWKKYFDYKDNEYVWYFDYNSTGAPSYTDFSIKIEVDGSVIFDKKMSEGISTNWNADSQMFLVAGPEHSSGARHISVMKEATVKVPVTTDTNEVKITFYRKSDLVGTNARMQFRAPRATFDYPQGVSPRPMTWIPASGDYYKDVDKYPNNAIVTMYPYIGIGRTFAFPYREQPFNDGKNLTADSKEYWQASANIYAQINGYDIAIVRNRYKSDYSKYDPFYNFMWTVQPISMYLRDGRGKQSGDRIPTKIDPPWGYELPIPSAWKTPAMTIYPPQWTYVKAAKETWAPIPPSFTKVYDPAGVQKDKPIEYNNIMEKELFGDVSVIDFVKTKDDMFMPSEYPVGLCDIVIPGYGKATDMPMMLLSKSFDRTLVGGTQVHHCMNDFKQTYARQAHWDATTVRLGVIGRVRAVSLIRLIERMHDFQFHLSDSARQIYDVYPDQFWAFDGDVKVRERGTGTAYKAMESGEILEDVVMTIFEMNVRPIVEQPGAYVAGLGASGV